MSIVKVQAEIFVKEILPEDNSVENIIRFREKLSNQEIQGVILNLIMRELERAKEVKAESSAVCFWRESLRNCLEVFGEMCPQDKQLADYFLQAITEFVKSEGKKVNDREEAWCSEYAVLARKFCPETVVEHLSVLDGSLLCVTKVISVGNTEVNLEGFPGRIYRILKKIDNGLSLSKILWTRLKCKNKYGWVDGLSLFARSATEESNPETKAFVTGRLMSLVEDNDSMTRYNGFKLLIRHFCSKEIVDELFGALLQEPVRASFIHTYGFDCIKERIEKKKKEGEPLEEWFVLSMEWLISVLIESNLYEYEEVKSLLVALKGEERAELFLKEVAGFCL